MRDNDDSFKMVGDPKSKTTRLEAVQPTSSSSLINSKKDSKANNPQEHFRACQLKVMNSLQENIGALSNEKRWMVAFVVSVLAILVYSTFTVSLVDQFLFKRDIDLFSKESKKNEIVLNIIQFILLFVFVRVVLSYL